MASGSVRHEIARIMTAYYGPNFADRKPDSFPDPLDRWMMAVLSDDKSEAEDAVQQIESEGSRRQGLT